MRAKHTRGTWSAEQHEGGGFDIVAAGAGHKGWDLTICSRAGHSTRGDEMHANGRLIAGAPDLLEAAQAAWNCIADLPPTQARVEVVQLLQAAIEKVTGEEP